LWLCLDCVIKFRSSLVPYVVYQIAKTCPDGPSAVRQLRVHHVLELHKNTLVTTTTRTISSHPSRGLTCPSYATISTPPSPRSDYFRPRATRHDASGPRPHMSHYGPHQEEDSRQDHRGWHQIHLRHLLGRHHCHCTLYLPSTPSYSYMVCALYTDMAVLGSHQMR
jgi:hypothetical protein